MSALDGLKAAVASAFSGVFQPAYLLRIMSRTSDGRGGWTTTADDFPCKALVTDYTTLQRSQMGIPASERRVSILGGSLALAPVAGDVVDVQGGLWKLIEIRRDPVGAVYECRAMPSADVVIEITSDGTLSVTIGGVSLSGAGAVRVTGSLAQTVAGVSLAGAGGVQVTGSLAQTIGAVTLSASGAVTGPATGSLAATIGAVTLSGAGAVGVSGSESATVAGVTGAASGAVAITGALAQTIGAVTLAATGTAASGSKTADSTTDKADSTLIKADAT